MKKLNFLKLLLVLIGLSTNNVQAMLTDEQIEGAKAFASKQIKIEEFTQNPEGKKSWLTIESFDFKYKGKPQTFWIANSFDCLHNNWGHLVICQYPIAADEKDYNLCLTSPADFSDFFGQHILSHLRYEYIAGLHPHFILEKVDTDSEYQGKGYSQVCVKYFLDEFVSKKTDVVHVITDCIVNSTRAYFPKCGFKAGFLDDYRNERVKKFPYYWVKNEEKK